MLLKSIIPIFLLIYFGSCQSFEKKDTKQASLLLSNLLKDADDNSIAINKRLVIAFQADSIAIAQKDEVSHLHSLKSIAILYLKQSKFDPAQTYFYSTIELAGKLSDFKTLGISLNNMGIIFNEKQNYDSAIKYYLDANKIFRKHGYSDRLAQGLVNLGIVYKNAGDFESAFKVSSEGAKILQDLNASKDLASAYTNMGVILKDLNRPDDALYYHQLALQLRRTEKDSTGIASSLHNLANVYRIKKDYRKALANYDSALMLKKHLGLTKASSTTLDNIGEVYFELGEYRLSEAYFKKALAIRIASQDLDGILTTLNKLTRLFMIEGKLKEAEQIALKADSLSPGEDYLRQRLPNAIALSEIYMKRKNYKLAAEYAIIGLSLKDSLYKTDMADTVFLLNEKGKTQQKEKELLLSRQLQKVQFSQIQTQHVFIIVLVILLASLLLALYLLLRSNKRVNQAKQRIEVLLKELNHRVKNNLQLVSDMLHLQKQVAQDPIQAIQVQSSINRVESMNIIHTLLYKTGYREDIDMTIFVRTLINNLAHTYNNKSGIFRISIISEQLSISIDKAIPLGLIINELVTNIFKYAHATEEPPLLTVKLTENNNNCKLEIIDNCVPWSYHEIKTKKNGLGLFLIETLVKQLGGKWNFVSSPEGTIQSVEFNR